MQSVQKKSNSYHPTTSYPNPVSNYCARRAAPLSIVDNKAYYNCLVSKTLIDMTILG